MTFTVLVYEDEEEGGFWATVAELPGCFTTGETIKEIESNIKDAIETHLDALRAVGQEPPRPATRKLEIVVPA